MIFYINHRSLISPDASSFGAVLRPRGKDMKITISHNKPSDRKWGWSVDDVMPRRDGPENLGFLKDSSWVFDR